LGTSSEADVRQKAAESLGRVGGLRATVALRSALEDRDTAVRIEAVVALGTIKGARAVDALIEARRRGVVVLVLLDKAQATSNSSSHNLRVIAQRLTALGVRVRLYKSRRLRATALLTDQELLLGSTNWTVEAQSSVEQGVTLRLFDAARRDQELLFKELWKEAAKDWNAGSEPNRGASRPSSALASSP